MAFRRTNGFTWPPCKEQIFCVLTIILFFCVFYSTSILISEDNSYIYGITIYSVFSIIFTIIWFILELLDPSIEKGHDLCCFYDQHEIRFCATCQKKVMGLDHHCIWLNTCISRRTYSLFITLIVDGILMHITQFSYSTYVCYLMFIKNFSIVSIIFFILYEIYTLVILTALCILLYNQILVMKSGHTTYGYLLNQRRIQIHKLSVQDNKLNMSNVLKQQIERELKQKNEVYSSYPIENSYLNNNSNNQHLNPTTNVSVSLPKNNINNIITEPTNDSINISIQEISSDKIQTDIINKIPITDPTTITEVQMK